MSLISSQSIQKKKNIKKQNMKMFDQIVRNIGRQQKNVSGWMGSWVEKIGNHIKKTYSPPEVATLILLSVLLIYVFIQILKDYLEERSRKKK